MMDRRNFLKFAVGVAATPSSRLSPPDPICPVCKQPCIGEADSEAVAEWEDGGGSWATICYRDGEGLFVHRLEEYQ